MVEPKTTKEDKPEAGISVRRIRTIMRSTAETGNINGEGLFLMTKATEMFIQYLAKSAAQKLAKNDTIQYDNLAQLVNDQEHLEFLLQIIPQKITVREFNEIIAKGNSDSESSSEEEEEEKKPPSKKKK